MLFHKEIPGVRFWDWIKRDKKNKICLITAAILLVVQFAVFKFLYPFPNFMQPDSDNYLEAAQRNDLINIWPIGYSKFLRLVSSFSNSHFVLVSIQYLFLEGAILYLLFSIKFFFSPGKWVFRMLFILSILNPLIPHIGNFVSSDALFTALSLVWFTQLFWIIYKPNKNILISHGIVLLFAFMVRYNALYYPVISIAVILLKTFPVKVKVFTISSVILLLGLFIWRTEYEYYKVTGRWQFSAFGGWQIASNALYGYAHGSIDPVEKVPGKFKSIHRIVNNHMDSISRLSHRPDKEVAIYYLWDLKSPLRAYMKREVQLKGKESETFLKKWAMVSPMYAQYGQYLIITHPVPFLKHYAWPNLIKYYAPPVGFMDSYNMGSDTVNKTVSVWFGWRNKSLPSRLKNRTIEITALFTELTAIINIVFILGLISLVVLGGFTSMPLLNKQMILITFFVWFANIVFSVLAAPIELRYQIFPIVLSLSFGVLFLAYVIQVSRQKINVSKEPESIAFEPHQTSIQLP